MYAARKEDTLCLFALKLVPLGRLASAKRRHRLRNERRALEAAAGRSLATRFRMGQFDPPRRNPWHVLRRQVVNSERHRALARRAAAAWPQA